MKERSHWPIAILSTVSAVFSMLLPLLLVRIITPEEVGVFKIFFLYLTILPAFSLSAGIMSGLAYWSGQADRSRRPIKASSTMILVLATAFVLVALLFRGVAQSSFGWSESQTLYFALALWGAIAGTFFEEAAISTGWIWTGALFYSGFEILRTSLMLVAAYYYGTLSAVLFAHSTVLALKVICGYVYGYKLGLVGLVFDRNDWRAVWRYAFPVSLAWVFGIFVTLADQFILSAYISPSEFALYSIGCLSIAPLLILEHSVTRVLIPQMAEAFSMQQNDRAAVLYKLATEKLSFLLIPAVTGLIIFATPIIELLFTPQYSEASQYLRLYALTYLLLAIPYDALARSRGDSAWILRTFIIFAIISLVCAYTFTSLWGPIGALSAVLLSAALMRIYSLGYFKSIIGRSLRDFLPLSSFAYYTFICGVLATLVLIARPLFSDANTWFLVCGGGFAVLYLLFANLFRARIGHTSQPARGVLMVTQSLNIGGLERMVLQLSTQLQLENRWSVYVLAYDHIDQAPESLSPQFAERDIPVESFKKSKGFSLLVVARILRSIYLNKIAVLHSQDLGGLIYAVLAKLCCFGCVRLVHTQHSFIHLERESRYRIYERLLTYFIDQLSVVSEDTKKTYLDLGIDKEKVQLVPNGLEFTRSPLLSRTEKIDLRARLIEQAKLSRSLQSHSGDLWILYMARFFPGKGQAHALQIWNEMQAQFRERSILVFVGPESAEGEYKRTGALVEDCLNPERIFLLGPTRKPQQWLDLSDVYLSCSKFEGMPLGPLEAVCSGLPSLLSSIPGHEFLSEVSQQYPLDDYQRGAAELERILQRISEESSAYFQEVWRSSASLRNHFSVEEMARKYSNLYNDSATTRSASFTVMRESLG